MSLNFPRRKLTLANRVLSRPISIGHAASRVVADQIPSLRASEHGDSADESLSGIHNEVFVDVWYRTCDLHAKWRFVSPSAIFRTQSSRHAIEFEVGEALVECGGTVISGVGRKCHSSVDDRRRTSTVNV